MGNSEAQEPQRFFMSTHGVAEIVLRPLHCHFSSFWLPNSISQARVIWMSCYVSTWVRKKKRTPACYHTHKTRQWLEIIISNLWMPHWRHQNLSKISDLITSRGFSDLFYWFTYINASEPGFVSLIASWAMGLVRKMCSISFLTWV